MTSWVKERWDNERKNNKMGIFKKRILRFIDYDINTKPTKWMSFYIVLVIILKLVEIALFIFSLSSGCTFMYEIFIRNGTSGFESKNILLLGLATFLYYFIYFLLYTDFFIKIKSEFNGRKTGRCKQFVAVIQFSLLFFCIWLCFNTILHFFNCGYFINYSYKMATKNGILQILNKYQLKKREDDNVFYDQNEYPEFIQDQDEYHEALEEQYAEFYTDYYDNK
ncbi:hypothetical protein EDEG_00488 [Edhazardia aedis USNM 41457]|uniref:Uncharacterized protein n=1 Tax=Edhazardia aedis (strain USNM 41457) TaxID=1003232 RepID=J8ZNR3_EDHAE|nr:hypothetical protein EDEG_00488 [Edhazardia aedis USNM 41457]|eukprot:EJW01328.1 hypothetical protein EDEG_00488 [Edhazardia aedis USNM 41457]